MNFAIKCFDDKCILDSTAESLKYILCILHAALLSHSVWLKGIDLHENRNPHFPVLVFIM